MGAYDPVRRLVADRLQVWDQLSASYGCPRWRSCQSHARVLHDLEQHGDRGGHVSYCPQVRPHVRQACLRPPLRRRRYGGGRVQRGSRGFGCPREGLRGGRHRDRGMRGRGGRVRRRVLSCSTKPPRMRAAPRLLLGLDLCKIDLLSSRMWCLLRCLYASMSGARFLVTQVFESREAVVLRSAFSDALMIASWLESE